MDIADLTTCGTGNQTPHFSAFSFTNPSQERTYAHSIASSQLYFTSKPGNVSRHTTTTTYQQPYVKTNAVFTRIRPQKPKDYNYSISAYLANGDVASVIRRINVQHVTMMTCGCIMEVATVRMGMLIR
jgi:hypothetical protein